MRRKSRNDRELKLDKRGRPDNPVASIMNADPGNLNSELETLKAQVQALHENERRLLDMVKVYAGLLIGMAAILVIFAWFASHKNYEQDKAAIQTALEKSNEARQAAFNRELEKTLNSHLNAREQAMDRKVTELAQQLRGQMSTNGGVSSNTLVQLNEDIIRRFQLMPDLIEGRYAPLFGMVYFDYAIRAANAKNQPLAAEYFLSASVAFLRVRDDRLRDEQNLNTSFARLTQMCFPALRAEDFTARPQIEEKFKQLMELLDANNVNGRYTVALGDLRKEFFEAKKRAKAK